MKIIIDTDKIGELSINMVIYLYDLYYNKFANYNDYLTDKEYNTLIKLKYIREVRVGDKIIVYIRQKTINLINELLETDFKIEVKDKISSRKLNELVDSNIDKFRNIWKGLKPGSMGSLAACREKLKKWLINNPTTDFEDIIKAAKIYIQSLNGNYKYLQRADYFIYKKQNGIYDSRLDAFIGEINNIDIVEDDWTNNLI